MKRSSSQSVNVLCAPLRGADVVRSPISGSGLQGALAQAFVHACLSGDERTAIRTADACWSYGDLLQGARMVAMHLRTTSQFEPGDRVVVMAPNSAEYVTAFFGTLLAGGVVVPLPTDIEADRAQSIIETTQASHILTSQGVRLRWNPPTATDGSPVLQTHIEDDPQELAESDVTNTDDLAAIFFTSGSSGTPKGVMLSHRNLIANARSIQQYLHIDQSERALAVLPFPHAFGNSVLQSHLLAGAELVLDGSPIFPESIVDALNRHACTSFSAVPDLFRTLSERSSLGDRPLPSLRYMAVAGGALPHALSVRITERIAPAQFYVMYGQTEATARLSFVPPNELVTHPGTIGSGIPGVELQVVDEDDVPVALGQVGEIRARGSNIMLGYWQDAAATSQVIRNGWLYTGDLGTIDEEGRVSIRGRRSALLKIAGYRVHPREIEDFVTAHLNITQAVVVPFTIAEAETRLALFARPSTIDKHSLTESHISAVCRQHLPRHRVPDIVQIVDVFPLTPSMKIDRPRLSQIAHDLESERRRAA